MLISRKSIVLLTLSTFVTVGAAYWVLLNPRNPLTRLFQREISDVDARIVIGPYPSEADFRLLKSNNVGLVVSLLDPAIPYEASLLQQEQELARQYHLELRNFPMSSILGQKFGNYYDESAAKAAAAIEGTERKVYLHCYLGMHRIQAVRSLLAARGVQAGTYAVRAGEREEASLATDRAEAAYNAGRYQEAIDVLAKIDEHRLSDNARVLRAWSHYRLGHIRQSAELFQQFVSVNPDNPEAAIGLGYCAYRDGNLTLAEEQFNRALARLPGNADALGGLGLTCWRANRLDEAARYLDAALRATPDNRELLEILDRIRKAQAQG